MYADDKFCELSPPKPSGQSLWIYLLTGPFSTLIPGICVGGEAGIAEALRWRLPEFRRAFQEIAQQGMARADWLARVIFLPKALRHNPPQSPSVVTGWRQAWAEVPACALKTSAALEMRTALVAMGPAYQQAFEAFAIRRGVEPSSQVVTQPVGQVVEQPASHQEQEQDQEIPPTPLRGAVREDGDPLRPHPLDEAPVIPAWSVEACDQFLAVYPRKEGHAPAKKAWIKLNPSRSLVDTILADVRGRVAKGWGADGPQFVCFPAKYLTEQRWHERWTPRASALATAGAIVAPDGRRVAKSCPTCGGVIEGRIVQGQATYPPCGTCVPAAPAVRHG